MSERRSREGLGKDNGRTNVNLLLEKRERDWTELIFAKISGLATVSRDRAEMAIYIGDLGTTTTLNVHHAFFVHFFIVRA